MKYKNLSKVFLLVALLMGAAAAQAQFTATGKVTDSKGEGLIGATIAVEGASVGTVTDADGNFRLQVPSGTSARLRVSYTGYASQTMEVNATSAANLTVGLEEDYANLEEVVISGLATNVKRANAANAVSSISSKELVGTTIQSSTDAALYGKLTG